MASIVTSKASGGSGIPAELFQILKDDTDKVLHSICYQICKTQQWPQDWKRSVFIPISKKVNTKEYSNYCTIVLISHASKIMLKTLQAMFSSENFIVSGLAFRSLIQFEFIFVYSVRKCSNFILLHVAVQFSQHRLLKRLIQPLWKTVWRFLKKLGIKPPYDSAIPLLGIYPEETKIERDTYIPLFIAALFTIARTWKQPRCPLTDEWIKMLWYIYTMEYYSAIKWNTFESVLMRWLNLLEPIIQSEVSQKEKGKYHILTHICGI